MLDVGFEAKASSLTPRPSVFDFEARMSDRNVSWDDKDATHSFMSLKLIRKLGLASAESGQAHQYAV
jgi:hypothetical protein